MEEEEDRTGAMLQVLHKLLPSPHLYQFETHACFTDRIYTGFSRGKRERDVKVFVKGNEDGLTSNIVYPELIS